MGWLKKERVAALLFMKFVGYEPEAPLPPLNSIPLKQTLISFHQCWASAVFEEKKDGVMCEWSWLTGAQTHNPLLRN